MEIDSRKTLTSLIVFVLAFDLAFAAQKLGGAYQNEFGGHPHEASYYLSGLFWRDFILSAWQARAEGIREPLSERKKRFAEESDWHYPPTDVGRERSIFTGLEGAWMLALPPVRGSLLILMSAFAALAATQLFHALSEEYGRAAAGFAAAILLLLPLMRTFTGLVMPDVLGMVFIFGAALAFGDFIDRERVRDAAACGILGVFAILNGASGLALVFAMPAAFLLSRKFHLLVRPAFWIIALPMVAATWLRWPGFQRWDFFQQAAGFYAGQFGIALGLVLFAFTAIGLLVKVRHPGKYRARWVAAGCLLLGVPIYHALAPGPLEARNLLPALPAALMFATAGGIWLVDRLAPRKNDSAAARFRLPLQVLLAALALATAVVPWTRTPCTGFAPLAEALVAQSGAGEIVLVSSDPIGEERFVAELAARDLRPGHIVLCGTRLLAHPGKKRARFEPFFYNDDAVFDFLISSYIGYLVIDSSVPDRERRELHYQIKRAVEEHLDYFWVVITATITRDGIAQPAPVKLYKIKQSGPIIH